MNHEEAREALAILRNVVTRARDDSAMQNWGLIWMVHGVTNGIGFAVSNYLLATGVRSVPPHLAVWMGILVFNFGFIALARSKRQGVTTFVERQMWSIWLVFLAAVYLVAGVNELMHLEIFFLAPMVAVLAAVALAMMGSLIGRVYYLGAVVFAVVSQLMAVFPAYGLYIFGACWSLSQLGMGLNLHLQKLRLARASARIA